MLAWILVRSAAAACAVQQESAEDGVNVMVRALEEPVGCRTVTLTADAPITLTGWLWTPEDRRRKLRKEELRLLPGGGWEVGAPELLVGGRIELHAALDGSALQVRLAPAEDDALRDAHVDETRTISLDPRHPGWGFADPKRALTRVDLAITLPADATARIVPVPADATDVDTGGFAGTPGGVVLPAGTTSAHLAYTIGGAEPLGDRVVPPGSLTLVGSGVKWVANGGAGVTVATTADGVRFEAPAGGQVRWRVASAGPDAVVPDAETYRAGLDWRFARVSLPEPAVPMWLRGRRDRDGLLEKLVDEVRAARDGTLPGGDPLHPRQLNRAWKSGWVTPVERALILHRFLGQEKYRADWVVTGEHADAETLTGFDTMLVRVALDGETRWIDPACTVCAAGEIGTRWLGKPAIGGAPEVPTAPGSLTRSLAIQGERFHVRFAATGAAALWLREQLVGVEPALRPSRVAGALGMPGATLVSAEGFDMAGAPVTVVLEGDHSPRDPFPPDATPWSGGWVDALTD